MKKHFMTTKDNSCLKFTHDVKIVANVAEIKNIFDSRLIESMDVEPEDMEGPLYL